ncbi:MAG: RluA family pseudouridine synthase [Pseudomonadota bacterium]
MQAPGDPQAIGVIAETIDFLVLEKPAGLLSVPGKAEPDCLEQRVQRCYPDALTVHRLDMATSGICVMARGKTNLADLQQQFEKRKTTKVYEAVVTGEVAEDAGTIDAPMICDWPNRPLQMIDHEKGRQAVTHWRVIGRQGDRTRLELTPITGRSHQLRVHMKSIGHAILGDRWYADDRAIAASPRLLLHARELGFISPTTGQDVRFSSPCPF